jgi:hypothetical protein
MITKSFNFRWVSGVLEANPGKSVKITINRKYPKTGDAATSVRTYKVGDLVRYDDGKGSVFLGNLLVIGEKTITIQNQSLVGCARRMSLLDFALRNCE